MNELVKFLTTTKTGKASVALPPVIVLFSFWWLATQITEMRERLVRIETRLNVTHQERAGADPSQYVQR